uniref:Transmembrane protein 242 n=1 Tax=Pseudo-nitzschia delicatissima TaxID=44447 RepID=A0A7S0UHR5_9STRA|mmetsp:Transcript_4856/g.10080  ORF Transcript_4856/g.10080 Transcript_4856/m.10080 type:complete len:261 (+) Transcript_4856:430-1212(+)
MSSVDSEKNVGNQTQAKTSTSEGEAVATKVEESSSGWTSDFFENGKSIAWITNPGNILLITSVPFFAGAYFGYRMPTEQLEDLIGSVGGTDKANGIDESSNKASRTKTTSGKQASGKVIEPNEVRVVAARTASKALRIATLGTVGTFGFLGAVGFYMSGYKSLEEAVAGTTRWASSWGKSLEHAMGGDQAVSKTHPDVLATKDMKSEEELRYVYDKYIKEAVGDEDTLWGDGDGMEKEKDPSPTLYSVYEKYFKTKEEED